MVTVAFQSLVARLYRKPVWVTLTRPETSWIGLMLVTSDADWPGEASPLPLTVVVLVTCAGAFWSMLMVTAIGGKPFPGFSASLRAQVMPAQVQPVPDIET